MSERPQAPGGHVRPLTALAFATAAFVALVIFGLGMLSLLLDEDVIEAPGLGQAPGILAIVFATVAFAAGLWAALRMRHPSFWGAALDDGGDLPRLPRRGLVRGCGDRRRPCASAVAVAGRIATSWFGVVIAAAALVCAWGGIALVRTGARRPRWPWEDEFDE